MDDKVVVNVGYLSAVQLWSSFGDIRSKTNLVIKNDMNSSIDAVLRISFHLNHFIVDSQPRNCTVSMDQNGQHFIGLLSGMNRSLKDTINRLQMRGIRDDRDL